MATSVRAVLEDSSSGSSEAFQNPVSRDDFSFWAIQTVKTFWIWKALKNSVEFLLNPVSLTAGAGKQSWISHWAGHLGIRNRVVLCLHLAFHCDKIQNERMGWEGTLAFPRLLSCIWLFSTVGVHASLLDCICKTWCTWSVLMFGWFQFPCYSFVFTSFSLWSLTLGLDSGVIFSNFTWLQMTRITTISNCHHQASRDSDIKTV